MLEGGRRPCRVGGRKRGGAEGREGKSQIPASPSGWALLGARKEWRPSKSQSQSGSRGLLSQFLFGVRTDQLAHFPTAAGRSLPHLGWDPSEVQRDAEDGGWEPGSSHRQGWASPTAEAEALKQRAPVGTPGCLARSGSGPWTWGQRGLPPRSWDLKSRDKAAPRDPTEKEPGKSVPWSHFPPLSVSCQHRHLLNPNSSCRARRHKEGDHSGQLCSIQSRMGRRETLQGL